MSWDTTTHLDQDGNELPQGFNVDDYELVAAASKEIYHGGDLVGLFAGRYRNPVSRKQSGAKAWWRKREVQ